MSDLSVNDNLIINKGTLVDIANAIRSKTGGTEKILVSEIASEARTIIPAGVYTIQGTITTPVNGQCTITLYKNGEICTERTYLACKVKSGSADWRDHGSSAGNFTGIKTWSYGGTAEGIAWDCFVYSDSTRKHLLANVFLHAGSQTDGGEQATPVISVNTSGLITATAGTKSATKQLAFQPAKTITPSTVSQIAVSSGYYTGGDITVNPIPSEYVIPNGTLTITANGTHDVKNYASATVEVAGGSGETAEWSENEDAIITRSISGVYANDRVATIGNYAFYECSRLTSVNFPACTTIGSYAFYECTSLTSVNFPACTSIGYKAFEYCSRLTSVNFPACTSISWDTFALCSRLTSVNFPACTTIGNNAFEYCSSLTSVNFPACTTIGSNAFYKCSSLTSVNFPACTTIDEFAFMCCYRLSSFTLEASTVCTLSNSSVFNSTPYTGVSVYFTGTPYIYVPSSLVTAYQSTTNWAYFASYIVAIGTEIENEENPGNIEEYITFTINDAEYQAESDMTWAEWCASEYNTAGYYVDGDYIALENGLFPLYVCKSSNYLNVNANDAIALSNEYYAE